MISYRFFNLSPHTSSPQLHEYVDDTENNLHEYVDDTEDYVNAQLDYRRNQLQGTAISLIYLPSPISPSPSRSLSSPAAPWCRTRAATHPPTPLYSSLRWPLPTLHLSLHQVLITATGTVLSMLIVIIAAFLMNLPNFLFDTLIQWPLPHRAAAASPCCPPPPPPSAHPRC
ncbi:unnamed protein product [Closterium sp. NIES-64]|nr:unnamed protein product [Closterium sp. NIES-65]CAI6005240.1 unnamed protein product [Closterium sp. NIES-64]